jgi:hypothetical protein
LDRRFAHGPHDIVEAIFRAPADTTIAAYSLWRSAQVTLSSQFQYAFAVFEGVRDTPHVIQECNGAKGTRPVPNSSVVLGFPEVDPTTGNLPPVFTTRHGAN